jgi:hypothetical protein
VKGMLAKAKKKVGWEKAFTLVFLCESSDDSHECSASEGIEVTLPGDTLIKLAPLLRAAAAVIKLAAAVGRLYNLPLPDGVPFKSFASDYSEQLETLVAAAGEGQEAVAKAKDGTKLSQRATAEGGALEKGLVYDLLKKAAKEPKKDSPIGGLTKHTTGEGGVRWLCAAHSKLAAAGEEEKTE